MKHIYLQNMTLLELENLFDKKINNAFSKHLESQKPNRQKLLNRKEVSSLLRISLVTLSKLTSSGKLKGYRVGKKILYKEAEIESFLIQITPLKSKK